MTIHHNSDIFKQKFLLHLIYQKTFVQGNFRYLRFFQWKPFKISVQIFVFTDHFLPYVYLLQYSCCGVTGKEQNCTSETTDSSNTTSSYTGINILGCADAVNEQIQLVATEIGYYTTILSVLQVKYF